jgi:hypothetical protein
MNKMTSKDETVSKIEKLGIVFLIMHDVNELFICIKNALSKCEQWFCIIVRINDSLQEFIAFCIEDE